MRTWKETPWGPSQTEGVIAEGITLYTTASHGGFALSPERAAVVRANFPHHTPWLGFPKSPTSPTWYEEDCDALVVVLSFPEFFPNQDWNKMVKLVRATCQSSQKLYQNPSYHGDKCWEGVEADLDALEKKLVHS